MKVTREPNGRWGVERGGDWVCVDAPERRARSKPRALHRRERRARPTTARGPTVLALGRAVMRSAAFGLAGSMIGRSLARKIGGSEMVELGLSLVGQSLGMALAVRREMDGADLIELEFASQFVELEHDLEVMPGVVMPRGSVGAVLEEEGGALRVIWPDLGPCTWLKPRDLRPSSREDWERAGGRP